MLGPIRELLRSKERRVRGKEERRVVRWYSDRGLEV